MDYYAFYMKFNNSESNTRWNLYLDAFRYFQ